MNKYTLLLTLALMFGGCLTDSEDSTDKKTIEGFTDYHDNTYEAVELAERAWTTSNLKLTQVNDSVSIPIIKDLKVWDTLTTAACFQSYDNEDSTDKYGLYYNYYAMELIDSNLQDGWRVSTGNDWDVLEKALYFTYGADYAKTIASNEGWEESEETGAIGNEQSKNNATGLNMFPMGQILEDSLSFVHEYATFWIPMRYDDTFNKTLIYDSGVIFIGFSSKENGHNIRLVRDVD